MQLLARKSHPPPSTSCIALFFSTEQLDQLQLRVLHKFSIITHTKDQDCVAALVCMAVLMWRSISNVLNVSKLFLYQNYSIQCWPIGLRWQPLDEVINVLSWVNAMTSTMHDLTKTAFAICQSFIQAWIVSYQTASLLAMMQLWRQVTEERENVNFAL
jgi:hypothetical protein